MSKMDRCPNCFQMAVKQGRCGACGYEYSGDPENGIRLPLFSMLAGKYMIGRILGAGGFGITYKAYDARRNMFCAVKEFFPSKLVFRNGDGQIHTTAEGNRADFEHGKKRFMEEAQMLVQLYVIPEVTGITDYFSENNTVYFVMEYLEGATLEHLMASYGGRIPVEEALSIICRVGNALEQVHVRANIFHRDISASNIMVTREGKVKLIDFGNAKYLIGRESQNLTVIVKHGYAPPEQYSSTSAQGSYTDVYALAATFYHIVTGKLIPYAFDRTNGETYRKLKEMGIPVSEEVSDAVDRALVLNSAQRTQTAGQFVKELGGGARHGPYLKRLDGQERYVWNLPENVTVMLGRSGRLSNIVPSSDGSISKQHCEIFYDSIENLFYIVDRSTNGTYVKGSRLEKGKIYQMPCGMQFSLGRDVCVLEAGVMR